MVIAAAALAPILMCCQTARAGEQDVMRVEQDWEVVLNEPDRDVDAPQFHTVISPYSDLDSFHLQISWNYRESELFSGGGMQLRAWCGEFPAGSKSYRDDKLSTTAETISWSQAMRIDGCGNLTFSVDNGSSITWGSFGGTDATSLTGQTGRVVLPNLNSYTTATSVENSWITYGANRVDEIRIKEVRRYNSEGVLLSRDTTPKVIYNGDH